MPRRYQRAFSARLQRPLLILIYAVVILGGIGSIAGVFVGAIVINCTLEVLAAERRTRGDAGSSTGSISCSSRSSSPWRCSCWCSAATVAFGVRGPRDRRGHAVAARRRRRGPSRRAAASRRSIKHWVVHPDAAHARRTSATTSTSALVVGWSSAREPQGLVALAALVPTLYLTAFVWENCSSRTAASRACSSSARC